MGYSEGQYTQELMDLQFSKTFSKKTSIFDHQIRTPVQYNPHSRQNTESCPKQSTLTSKYGLLSNPHSRQNTESCPIHTHVKIRTPVQYTYYPHFFFTGVKKKLEAI